MSYRLLLLLSLLLGLAACGSSPENEPPTAVSTNTAVATNTPTPTIAPTETAMPTETAVPTETATPLPPTPTATPAPPTPTPLPATDETVSSDWQVESLAVGIKPAIELDSQDKPHITYMVESEQGYVKYITLEDGVWAYQIVDEGYFYGPPAITVDDQDRPHIVYHDHQQVEFAPDVGDGVRALLDGETWRISTIADAGHDGWDNSIVVDSDGVAHTAAIDPSQFESTAGVEYAVFNGRWQVEEIGSGPIVYEFGTAIAVDSSNIPAITYFDDVAGVLQFARREADGWVITAVDTAEGYLSAGKFSSLVYDANDRPHITYFVEETETSGLVRYATWDGSAWQLEDIDTLQAIEQGTLGARHTTWLRLDSQGRPHVAYNDQAVLRYGVRSEVGWQLETVAEAGSVPFGQLVVMDLDSADQPHLVYTVFTIPIIPEGVVRYATRPSL